MPIGSFDSLEHLIVTLTSTDGLVGHGEATVIPEFMNETLTQLEAELDTISRHLRRANPQNLDEMHEIIDRELPASRSARAAVDEAYCDVFGQQAGVPAWRLLGVRQRESVDCTWVIGLKSARETVDEALAVRSHGYQTFKVKVGEDDDSDVEKVLRLRQALGPEATIRLDANGAYSPERAFRTIGEMMQCGPEMVEQPCAASELAAMARLRRALGVKVLADESVFSAEDAERVIDAGAADLINIKVQKLGGLHRARRVADIVEKAGLRCIVGSCLEVGPGVAASAHFAVTCRSASAASDLMAGLQLSGSSKGTEFGGVGPTIREPSGAGLGWTFHE